MPRPKSSERWKPKVADQPILERIHDRFEYCVDRWEKIRREAKEDMRHVKGDPWKPDERLAREKAKRPVIALDELGQYENQVVNEVRANPRAIKFDPVGDGANDKTALFYGNKTREIEYRSHAQQHYTRAFQNMVERSYGYCKIRTEYVTDQPAKPGDPWSAFNKRLVIDGVPDPDSIYPDPDFLDATGRDWKFLFELESMTTTEFERAYPKAEIKNFTPELVRYSNGWISGKTIRVASYWELEKTTKTLQAWAFTDPTSGQEVIFELWADDDAKVAMAKSHGGTLKAEREVEEPHVCQYRTNGVEILKKTPWPGKWIPYIGFFGKMLWMEETEGSGSDLVIMSMTRLARDPNMLHAYYTSCEAEMIGITPKVPWWVWKGSVDKKNALKIQAANHEPVAYIEIDPLMVNGGNNAPTPSLPSRVPFEPPIQAIEIGKEGARRSIQAAMGLTPLPTSAQRRNEKSGVALKQIEESGQRGSYHFIDSYDMGIQRAGELIEDLLPAVHDTAGPTPVLLPDKKSAQVYINYKQPPADLPKGAEVLPSITGLHAVTIDVGPAFANERQMASDFVDTFVASAVFQALPPELALQILSLLIKLKNLGPIGEQIAELLESAEGREPARPETADGAAAARPTADHPGPAGGNPAARAREGGQGRRDPGQARGDRKAERGPRHAGDHQGRGGRGRGEAAGQHGDRDPSDEG